MIVITNREVYSNAKGGGLFSKLKNIKLFKKKEADPECGKKPLFGKEKKADWEECMGKKTQDEKVAETPTKSSAPTNPSVLPKQQVKEPKKSNTMLYVGIGVGVLVLTTIIVIAVKKK